MSQWFSAVQFGTPFILGFFPMMLYTRMKNDAPLTWRFAIAMIAIVVVTLWLSQIGWLWPAGFVSGVLFGYGTSRFALARLAAPKEESGIRFGMAPTAFYDEPIAVIDPKDRHERRPFRMLPRSVRERLPKPGTL
jgi:hypothetical protein